MDIITGGEFFPADFPIVAAVVSINAVLMTLHGRCHAAITPLRNTMTETDDNTIRLDQFLKLAGVAGTGGQAKLLIQGGEVMVNGEVETRRRRKLRPGDHVMVGDDEFVIDTDDE